MSTEVRKTCPTCAYSWLDKYGKNECPKCLKPLVAGGGGLGSRMIHTDGNVEGKRAPGEASTFKSRPSDAGESEKGACPKDAAGGPHKFKFGKCSACGLGEGAFLAGERSSAQKNKPVPGGECPSNPSGAMHVFKFSKCTHCGKSELAK